jgi:NAD(P)-dependent dehydrogenase (short-subunit alcohol dehydrogenase family)
MELAEWRDHQAINVEGPLFLTKTLLDYLRGGRILHISSGAAHHAYQGWGAYCTSKAALYMIYLTLREELKKYNIQVGSVRPGVVDTPMQDEVRKAKVENFPALSRFVDLKNEDKLFNPQAVADFIYKILTESNDQQFSEEEWDFTNK